MCTHFAAFGDTLIAHSCRYMPKQHSNSDTETHTVHQQIKIYLGYLEFA